MTNAIRLGFSSYSFHRKLANGEMSLFDVIDWISGSDGDHLELAVVSEDRDGLIPSVNSERSYLDSIKTKANNSGVTLSNLAVGANFFTPDRAQLEAEMARLKTYVDLADYLGIKLVRHDVVAHNPQPGDDTIAFEQALPFIGEAAKNIAQYAASKVLRPVWKITDSSFKQPTGSGGSSMP